MRVTLLAAIAAVALGALTPSCGVDEPVSRVIGARCDLASECDERCLTGGDFPGGFCSTTCDLSTTCPRGAACSADQGGVCLFTCVIDRDCEFLGIGWRCQQRDGVASNKVMVCRGG
jgi:hypothetical protein